MPNRYQFCALFHVHWEHVTGTPGVSLQHHRDDTNDEKIVGQPVAYENQALVCIILGQHDLSKLFKRNLRLILLCH